MNPISLDSQLISDYDSEEEVISDENITIVDSSDEDIKAVSSNGETSKKIKLSNDDPFCIPITSLMIGQYCAMPLSDLEIVGLNLSIKLPDIILRIKWTNITLIEVSQDETEPCLFLTIAKDYLKALHFNLNLVPGKRPCYNPSGSDDQKYMIFYINKRWHHSNAANLLRKLHRTKGLIGRSSIIKEISAKESNIRQFQVAEAEVTRHEEKKPLRPRAKQFKLFHTFSRSKSIVEKKLRDSSMTMAVYPPPPSPGGIVITYKDVACLDNGEYLNDVIIDFYLQYLVNELLPAEDRQRCHVFSSFFYKRLMQQTDEEEGHVRSSKRRHVRVQKWTRNVDVFSKDFIFIPLNEASHWYLAVICFPGNSRSEDSHHSREGQRCESTPSPCIAVFDSLQEKDRTDVSPYLREYLTEEWKSRKTGLDERVFNRRNMRCIPPSVPQQNNNSDCGLFLLHYVEKLFEIPLQDFDSRLRTLDHWFESREVNLKRKEIKKIIGSLRHAQSSTTA